MNSSHLYQCGWVSKPKRWVKENINLLSLNNIYMKFNKKQNDTMNCVAIDIKMENDEHEI